MLSKEAIEILKEIKKDNESKIMIINTNTSNIQIRWSNKDLKEMAEISNRCGKENRAIETVLNLLEKNDKIIDEMATYIATLDIEEDICEKTKNEHCDKMNFGECEDCIKQYFENKVTDTNVGERKVENGI